MFFVQADEHRDELGRVSVALLARRHTAKPVDKPRVVVGGFTPHGLVVPPGTSREKNCS